MEVFISEVKHRYPDRFIVLDAPSVRTSAEARILSQYCDHALLVVPLGKSTTDDVLSGIEAVGRDRFSGLMLNHQWLVRATKPFARPQLARRGRGGVLDE